VPLDYVLTLRIEEAKLLLEDTDMLIDAVASEIGYTEPATFRRIFRRLAGVSPLKYRRRFGTFDVARRA
jgi:transcriptional regulator GlxA family with amidase domain